jgi:hypothetical protein
MRSPNLIANPAASPGVTAQPPLARLFPNLLEHVARMKSLMVSINSGPPGRDQLPNMASTEGAGPVLSGNVMRGFAARTVVTTTD